MALLDTLTLSLMRCGPARLVVLKDDQKRFVGAACASDSENSKSAACICGDSPRQELPRV